MSDRALRRPGPWTARAACRGKDTNLWFPERGNNQAGERARGVCGRCPVRIDCRDYAIQAREPFGIWGGLGETGRSSLRARRGAA